MVTLSYCRHYWVGFKVHCAGGTLHFPDEALTQFRWNWTNNEFWRLPMEDEHQLYCLLKHCQHLHKHNQHQHLHSVRKLRVSGGWAAAYEHISICTISILAFGQSQSAFEQSQSAFTKKPEDRLLWCVGGCEWAATLLAEAPSSKSRLSWSSPW